MASADFHVSLARGRAVAVSGGAAGVDVVATFDRMAAAREHERAQHRERQEGEEAHAIQLMILSALVARLPPARAAQLQTLRAAWAVRAELWVSESAHGECTQDECQPSSMLTNYRYQDPVTQEDRRALGYVHVCTVSGRVHICTPERCDAVSSVTTAAALYVCRVTGVVYGQSMMTEGFRSNQEAARDTRTLPGTAAAPPPPAARARRQCQHVGGGRGARISANRTLPLDQRRALHAAQAKKRAPQATRIATTLLFGAPARASRENAQRQLEGALERADRACAAYLADCHRDARAPVASRCWALWLGATAAATAPLRPAQQGRYTAGIVAAYVGAVGAFWRLLMQSTYARAHIDAMHWGNHALATLYLLRVGCVLVGGGAVVVPADDWLARHLPTTGAVDLREHLALGKRAFSKGAEVIQYCLASLPSDADPEPFRTAAAAAAALAARGGRSTQ